MVGVLFFFHLILFFICVYISLYFCCLQIWLTRLVAILMLLRWMKFLQVWNTCLFFTLSFPEGCGRFVQYDFDVMFVSKTFLSCREQEMFTLLWGVILEWWLNNQIIVLASFCSFNTSIHFEYHLVDGRVNLSST